VIVFVKQDNYMQDPLLLIGKLLCWLGFHDFTVLSRTFGFGEGDGVEKVECKRCGVIVTRQN
jgi:hypothetical protein